MVEALREKGPGLFVLVDPERTTPSAAADLARVAEREGVTGLLIGTSFDGAARTAQVAAAIKGASALPLLLFPGSASQLVAEVDGVLLLSLVSGRNPQYLIEEHVRSVPFFDRSRKVTVISTGYILVDGGRITAVESVSQTRPLPADKPELAAAHALAARMIGMSAVYLDAGSGAAHPVPPAVVAACRAAVPQGVTLFVGGGIRTPAEAGAARKAGADFVVIGTAVEEGSDDSWRTQIEAFVRAVSA